MVVCVSGSLPTRERGLKLENIDKEEKDKIKPEPIGGQNENNTI